jgi:PEP-CTERM motif
MRIMAKSMIAGAFVSLATAAAPGVANAAPCINTTLDNWLESAHPGFNCAVGDKTFSNFSYSQDGFNGMNGHSNTPASSVGVGPAFTPFPGIGFNALWQNTGTTTADALLSFNVTAPATTPITNFELLLDGVLGSVLDVASLSNGVTISSNDNLLRVANFAPVTSLLVIDDIGVNAGTPASPSTISSVEKQFTQGVPEPASLAILGVSLLGMGVAYRRFRKQRALI